MHPGRIAGHNIAYTEPEGWDRKTHGQHGPWPMYARRIPAGTAYHIETAWFPTLQEIEYMVNGAPVYLSVIGKVMPAVKLGVGKPADDLKSFPRAINITRSMLANRAVTIMFEAPPSDEQLQILKEHLGGAAK